MNLVEEVEEEAALLMMGRSPRVEHVQLVNSERQSSSVNRSARQVNMLEKGNEMSDSLKRGIELG